MEEITEGAYITLTTVNKKSVKVFLDFIERCDTRRRTNSTEFVIEGRISLTVKETESQIRKLIREAQYEFQN